MAELSPSTLIATLGGQPQVLTFALDELLARGEALDEVAAVHVAPATPAMQQSLARLAGAFGGGRYGGRPCRLRSVVLANGAAALHSAALRDFVADIVDEAAAEATWQTLHGLLGRLKAEGRRLHLVVTGGPRLIQVPMAPWDAYFPALRLPDDERLTYYDLRRRFERYYGAA